jgi:hypothetical protein
MAPKKFGGPWFIDMSCMGAAASNSFGSEGGYHWVVSQKEYAYKELNIFRHVAYSYM